MNWYDKAKKSKDEHIKKLIEDYDSSEDKMKKTELENAIKIIIGSEKEEKAENPFEEKPKTKKEETRKKEIIEAKKEFTHTEESVKKLEDKKDELYKVLEDCRNEIKRLEGTRLVHETFTQKRNLDKDIWAIRRISYIARRLIYADKMKKKAIQNKNQTSLIATKRARFVRLFRMGISFSNMITHPDGVKKEDMIDIVNDDVIKSCLEIDRNFRSRWERWVEVKLKK